MIDSIGYDPEDNRVYVGGNENEVSINLGEIPSVIWECIGLVLLYLIVRPFFLSDEAV